MYCSAIGKEIDNTVFKKEFRRSKEGKLVSKDFSL